MEKHWGRYAMQVYVLAIVAAMQRGAEPNKESDLIILVPPYDPAEIFSPSYGHDEVAHKESAATPSLRCGSCNSVQSQCTAKHQAQQCGRHSMTRPAAHQLPAIAQLARLCTLHQGCCGGNRCLGAVCQATQELCTFNSVFKLTLTAKQMWNIEGSARRNPGCLFDGQRSFLSYVSWETGISEQLDDIGDETAGRRK